MNPGSPPRVRERLYWQQFCDCFGRITPACAGKTSIPPVMVSKNALYPVAISGNVMVLSLAFISSTTESNSSSGIFGSISVKGSPPRVRERHGGGHSLLQPSRITPACAGKTQWNDHPYQGIWDHPRVCGKDEF